MKAVVDVIRQPLVIGACIFSVFIVAGAYFGSHWYYGDVEPIDPTTLPTPEPRAPVSVEPVRAEGLPIDDNQPNIEPEPTVPIVAEESVDDFLASLSDEERALLTFDVAPEPERVSPFGFGSYPEVPADFSHDPIWVDYPNTTNALGGSTMMRALELCDRVLVELWHRGEHTDGGKIGSDDMVLPFYENTVYVRWDYTENPDGTTTRYARQMTSGPAIPEGVFDAISEGVVPAGITILDPSDHKIDPFTFLNLN